MKAFLLPLFSTLVLSVYAQTSEPCFYGAGEYIAYWCGSKPSAGEFEAYSKQDIHKNLLLLSHRDEIKWAPVFYHIITRDDGNCGSLWKDIFDGHCELNESFLPFKIGFYIKGFDTVPDTYLWNFEEPALGTTTFPIYNKPGVINVYINGNMPGLCGFATFPFNNPTGGGIFLHRNCIGADKTTYQHEMGHYLGLLHTFETVFGRELVNGANCSFTGDLYCDTPADFLDQRVPCPYTGPKTDPNGYLYRTVIDHSLFMSYFNDACQTRFSTMQQAQMTSILTGSRSFLLNHTPPDQNPPDTTSFINPADGNAQVNSSQLTFRWRSVRGAEYYRFSLRSVGSHQAFVDTLVADTFVYVGNITPNKHYKYYARPVSFGNTCGKPAPYRYLQTSKLLLNVKVVSPACSDALADSVIITPLNGTPPFTFQWSNGSEDSLLTEISPGEYTVTVNDRLGEKVVETILLLAPDPLTISIEANINQLVAHPYGGTPPYSFAWSNGVNNQFNNLPAFGDYTVTVTDAKGCVTTELFTYNSIDKVAAGRASIKISPNPASRQQNLNIRVELNVRSDATLSIMNIHGDLIYQIRRAFNPGITHIPFDSRYLPDGLYFIRLNSDIVSKTEKFTVVK